MSSGGLRGQEDEGEDIKKKPLLVWLPGPPGDKFMLPDPELQLPAEPAPGCSAVWVPAASADYKAGV